MRGIRRICKNRASTNIADVIMTDIGKEQNEKRHAERVKQQSDLYRNRSHGNNPGPADGR